MIDVKCYSTHTRRRTESVATELLAGGVTVEAEKSKLVGTRRDVERGWFAVSEILSREVQSEPATQIRHFVHQMLPAVTEKEWAASELVS